MIDSVSAQPFIISLGLTILLSCGFANAQSTGSQTTAMDADFIAGGNPAIDYSLRLNSRCVVSTPLVRLRDVATPINPPGAWWKRAGGVVIAMMPVDGGEMVIQRDRLALAISQDQSIPLIDWSGADATRVTLQLQRESNKLEPIQSGGPTVARENRLSEPVRENVHYRGNLSHDPHGAIAQTSSLAPAIIQQTTVSAKVAMLAELPELNPQDADRIIRLIHFAIDRADSSLRESYDISIDPGQYTLRPLADVRRIDRVEFASTPTEGVVQANVVGMNTRQSVSQSIDVQFNTRPMVVVPRDNLRRGHVITAFDLTLVPAPRGIATESLIKSMDDAVDMQVVNVLQKDRPISISSLSRPILIERGDLVEIHVVGGGVTVATNGRSLSRGAVGDLIAVETLEPRKKIIARVARSGLVEVFTRPPRVK